MSDLPTPETDAVSENIGMECMMVAAEFSRKLERERDGAKNKLADALQEVDLRTLDYERIKQERDEARELAAKWEAVALREASINGARICGKESSK